MQVKSCQGVKLEKRPFNHRPSAQAALAGYDVGAAAELASVLKQTLPGGDDDLPNC